MRRIASLLGRISLEAVMGSRKSAMVDEAMHWYWFAQYRWADSCRRNCCRGKGIAAACPSIVPIVPFSLPLLM
jgi:hypothetical protein